MNDSEGTSLLAGVLDVLSVCEDDSGGTSGSNPGTRSEMDGSAVREHRLSSPDLGTVNYSEGAPLPSLLDHLSIRHNHSRGPNQMRGPLLPASSLGGCELTVLAVECHYAGRPDCSDVHCEGVGELLILPISVHDPRRSNLRICAGRYETENVQTPHDDRFSSFSVFLTATK